MELEIRPFIESDRGALRRILKNEASYTTEGGKDEGKKECLCYMYCDYYFDFEPQNVLVSVCDGKPCGFILASTDTGLFRDRMIGIYIPRIRGISPLWAIFHRICVAVNSRQDSKGGVAFHINIDRDFQGMHIGTKLVMAMAMHMRARGVKHLYLVTKNRRTNGYRFYSRLGFKETRRYPFGAVMMALEL